MTVFKKVFEKQYRKLNLAQKEAVDSIEGPVMVIAGPGTGKTQILTLRIANILRKTDTAPENILAITFTESGAYSMRKRLVEIIGSGAYKVNIKTFHGFCNDIIKSYPEEFPRIIGSSTINEVDQIQILERIVANTNLKKLKSFADPYYFIKDILTAIRTLKREAVDEKLFKKNIFKEEKDFQKISGKFYDTGRFKGQMKGTYRELEKKIEKNKELSTIYSKYEKELLEKRLYDYEDMIVEVVKVLSKNKDLLLILQESYHYILADEHQDANASQNKVLELLCSFHENPNIFIVGDDKQAIFRFQGGSLDNFLYFKKLYGGAKLIHLEENYRSTQTILDASHSVIEKNPLKDGGVRKRLKSQKTQKKNSEKKIKLLAFSEPEYEPRLIVEDIKNRIKKDPKESIAVIYRNNQDADAIIEECERQKIAFRLDSEQNVLSDEDVSKFIILLRALRNLNDAEALSKLLFVDFLKIGAGDAFRVFGGLSKTKKNLFEAISSKDFLKKAEVEDLESFLNLTKKLSAWSQMAKIKNIVDVFEIIARESGFLEHVLSVRGSADKLSKLDALFTEVRKLVESKRGAVLSDFIDYLNILEGYHLLIKTSGDFIAEQKLRLLTAHRSKGLEFDAVYIINAYDTHWGNKRERVSFHLSLGDGESFEKNEDERRLFYVALTRSRNEVIITYSKKGVGGLQLPSQFIEEIDKKYLEEVDLSEVERRFKDGGSRYLVPKVKQDRDIKDQNFLRELFLDQGLSVTALNNYLECPWKYFFMNLLRLPRRQDKHLLFGIAIHEALKILFDKMSAGDLVTKKEFILFFERSINRLPLTETELEEVKEKGVSALSSYFDNYQNHWKKEALSEVSIAGVFVDVNFANRPVSILLKGVLDKIEFLNDSGLINVVDYKTGKPKSRNDIEGNTKNSLGNYKRQLIFYRLLVEKYFKGRYVFSSAEIDFVEPDEKGRHRKEKFIVTLEEVSELEDLIKKVALEILSFSFFDKKCEEKKCEYCALQSKIKKTAP